MLFQNWWEIESIVTMYQKELACRRIWGYVIVDWIPSRYVSLFLSLHFFIFPLIVSCVSVGIHKQYSKRDSLILRTSPTLRLCEYIFTPKTLLLEM